MFLRAALLFPIILVSVATAESIGSPSESPPLAFRIDEGRVINAFYQQGPIAAHLLLTSGTEPRVLVAFPAGNSGAGIWFEKSDKPVTWTLHDVKAAHRADGQRRTLNGVSADVSIDSPLIIRDAVLSSVRVLRDYQLTGSYPSEVKSIAKVTANKIEWSRNRLDGAAGYSVSIQAEGADVDQADQRLTLSPSHPGRPMRLTFTALTGETPLTPIALDHLLTSNASDDARGRNVLRFLAYDEKFLAGSWRFNTYFGRDTLMSLRLLMPVLQPEAIERGLMSVLQRLAPDGEVAHEEDIGEFAVLRHLKQGERANDDPIYDYKMVDDDFMLPAVAAAYLVDRREGRQRASAFLSRTLPSGEKVGAAMVRNFAWVVQSTRPFAGHPGPASLISLKSGFNVGDWRDSEAGLGGGRYPYDVNAILVPAALSSIASFVQSGLLHDFSEQRVLSDAASIADVWSREAPPLFRVLIKNAEARRQVTQYAAELDVEAKQALDALDKQDMVIRAIALDAQYKPVPILNSDSSFALLLGNPTPEQLEELVTGMLRPFPAGLLTDAGLLVANPVFADPERQRSFNRGAYHGTVTWSWQQALFAAGLARQIARDDLPAETTQHLRSAQRCLWAVIENTRAMRSSELWSWRFANGRYEAVPFGQSGGDADESNAAQLWSTVYLALRDPR